MPEPPRSTGRKMDPHEREIFRAAFDSAAEQGLPEGRRFAIAHAAVNKQARKKGRKPPRERE